MARKGKAIVAGAQAALKRGRGRPGLYDPDFARRAAIYCAKGATDAELADIFQVSIRSISRWRVEYPEFADACKIDIEAANNNVEKAMYHRAVGYSYDAVKIFNNDGVVTRVPYREHVPPDVSAGKFWTTNRMPDKWKERIEHVGSGGGPIAIIERQIIDVGRPEADHPNGEGVPAAAEPKKV